MYYGMCETHPKTPSINKLYGYAISYQGLSSYDHIITRRKTFHHFSPLFDHEAQLYGLSYRYSLLIQEDVGLFAVVKDS